MKLKRILWIIILVAALLSLGVFVQRWALESTNRQVEIVYDLPGLIELGQAKDIAIEGLLSDLKQAGVTTIAVQPESVGEWFLQNKPLPFEVSEQLPRQNTDLAKFLTLPVAFLEEQLDLLTQQGLAVAPKLNTSPWEVEPIWLGSHPELLIISGQGIFELENLHGSDARLALVEFSTPKFRNIDTDYVVRLHGISAPEMRVLSDERIINRYVRAVKERNIRVLYVRPFVEGEQSWQRSLDLLRNLTTRLEGAGFQVGHAQPFRSWQPSPLLLMFVAAGIWAGAIVYGSNLFEKWSSWIALGGLFGWIGTIGLILKHLLLAQQGLALLAAIVFPCLAIQILWGKTPFQRYWGTSAISLLGAFFVVASLTGTEYLVKLQEFRGVKLMHVVPIALVVFSLARPLKAWLKKDVPMRYLIWAGALGVAGVLYIIRTGNFGLPVLNLEVQAREFLENLLRTRPRTKEFMVGHPALYLSLQSEKPKQSWLLPVAVIGQLSLVNTFTHTHTVLWVSLLRTLYGLIFGYLIGWPVAKIYVWGKGRLRRDHGIGVLRIR